MSLPRCSAGSQKHSYNHNYKDKQNLPSKTTDTDKGGTFKPLHYLRFRTIRVVVHIETKKVDEDRITYMNIIKRHLETYADNAPLISISVLKSSNVRPI